MKKVRILLFLSLLLCLPTGGQLKSTRGLDLGDKPQSMTLATLQQAGLLDATQIDPTGTWTYLLVSERVHEDVWNQLYIVQFHLRTGGTFQTMALFTASTIPDVSSGPVVYVVSKVLNPEGKPYPAEK